MSDTQARLDAARKIAHQAVTEGVSLKYVQRMREAMYTLADDYEALAAELDREHGNADRMQARWHEAQAELERVTAALRDADTAASEAHNAIYAEPFDQKAASDAIWRIHNLLRPLAGGARAAQEDA
jgi:hypothetical protein